MKLCSINIVNSEVQYWLRNKHYTLLQHIEPSMLSLYIDLNARLIVPRFKAVSWLNQVYVCSCVKKIYKCLKLRPSIFRLNVFQMRSLLKHFWTDFSFYIDRNLFLDLDNNVAIDRLSLINRSVFIKLEHN